ncbi:Ribophorin I family protein [Tritrichomonas foetus]|uniref:Dolichyl-diphosphooligosaccharide--protein glycosyltransferase subunit 1 n=1 Tax=Tritrichomonas foetus TaxID=1144522 RepID=A0A1J4JV47_9EUKA|nr:Ribophorin I family protein [Tritrichomonas foetus]|eukprot:OHT02875.1 Ribophorin I family protein [Tritrichomonas foetus]
MLVAFFLSAALAAPNLVNTNVQRRYLIRDNLITVTVTADVQNDGDQSVREYAFSVTPREAAHIGRTVSSFSRKLSRSFEESLPIKREGNDFIVDLKREIAPGESVTIYFTYTLGDYFLFLRQKIQLNQKFGLYFNTTKFYHSRYPTSSSSLSIDGISKSQIIKKTEDALLKVMSSSLQLNSLTEDDGKDFEVEYTTARSLPRIDEINSRTVVSHWGKTKQSSFYSITNAGPKFVGEFNRIDFTQNSPCYLQNLMMTPPEGAYNFWATDESGQLQKDMELRGKELEIPLRGPMLSSWKATFTVGWTIDTSKFVSHHFRYRAPLLTPFISAPVRDVSAEIILPEGAKIEQVTVPIDANVTQFSEVQNLDLNGRVVVRIEVHNLSSDDEIPVTITYKLDYLANFLKIICLTAAFSILFCGIIIFRRIDCGINVSKPKTD